LLVVVLGVMVLAQVIMQGVVVLADIKQAR
jgi:hypothetical protein